MSATAPFTPSLGSEKILQLFISKRTVKVLHRLQGGKKRHKELRRALHPVSQKVLTHTLRDLETEGLILRVEHGTRPPSVEYSLTRLGKTFLRPLNALCQWAKVHETELAEIAARQGVRSAKPAGTREP